MLRTGSRLLRHLRSSPRVHSALWCSSSRPLTRAAALNPAVSPASSLDGLSLKWTPIEQSQFDYFWLRDHCQCAECYHPVTKQRLVDTFKIPENIRPVAFEVVDENLVVKWSDHKSVYNLEWLRIHSYSDNIPPQPNPWKKLTWDSSIASNPPSVTYDEIRTSLEHHTAKPKKTEQIRMVMESESGVGNWLRNVYLYGFCFVSNVPPNSKDTENLAEKICFIRETIFGKFWDFTPNLEHGDTAYTTLALGAHTDTTYFTDSIGLQMFHLLEHRGEGGSTLLVDGLKVARDVEEQNPAIYRTLTKVPLPTQYLDKSVEIRPAPGGYPIVELNHAGEPFRIRFNNDDRAPLGGQSAPWLRTRESVKELYDAILHYGRQQRLPQNEYRVQLKPGTVLLVDNWRVLHGRSAFTGHRRMVGCYINHDDYASRLRLLTGIQSHR